MFRLGLLVAFFSVGLLADSTVTYNGGVTNNTSTCDSFSGPCQIDVNYVRQFDSSLGTLNSWSLYIADDLSIDVNDCNAMLEPNPLVNYSYTFNSTANFLGSSGSGSLSQSGQTPGTCAGTQDIHNFIGTTITGSDPSQLSQFISNSPNSFIDMYGDLSLSGTASGQGVDGSFASISYFLEEEGSFNVTYDYTAVPEPRKLVLMIAGVCACVLIARRRSRIVLPTA